MNQVWVLPAGCGCRPWPARTTDALLVLVFAASSCVDVVVGLAAEIAADGSVANRSTGVALDEPSVSKHVSRPLGQMQGVLSAAQSMYKSALDYQKKQESELSLMKADLENNLTSEKMYNHKITEQIGHVREQVGVARVQNSRVRERVESLFAGNELLHTALEGIQTKIGLAMDFADETLKDTDTHELDELRVLEPAKPKVTLERLMAASRAPAADTVGVPAVANKEQPLHDINLLQGSARVRKRTEEGHLRALLVRWRAHSKANTSRRIVALLQGDARVRHHKEGDLSQVEETATSMAQQVRDSLAELRAARESGAKALTAQFLTMRHEIQSQREELNAEKQELEANLESQYEMQEKLHKAEVRMNWSRVELLGRLHGLEQFAHQVRRTALLAASMAALPSNSSAPNASSPKHHGEAAALAEISSHDKPAAAPSELMLLDGHPGGRRSLDAAVANATQASGIGSSTPTAAPAQKPASRSWLFAWR